METRDEYKFNFDVIDCLVRANLINVPQYDLHLVQLMENGHNYMAVAFVMQLMQRCACGNNND